jgi:YfiH family protein
LAGSLELIRPDWPAPASVRAGATTRGGGTSDGAYRGLNLADHVGDDPAAVRENRRRLARSLALPAEPLWLTQIHGATVAAAGSGSIQPQADAMTAARAGQVCAVLTADCLPVLFCNKAGTRVAAAHAGWRGLMAGVLEATIAVLTRDGEEPEDLLAWIGPAIAVRAYEVGADLRDAFLARDPAAAAEFSPNARGRWQLDLAAVARRRLAAAGVVRIWDCGLCTFSDPVRFFSHRRDGPCGRHATLIWLE